MLVAALFTPSRSLLLRRGRSLPVVLDAPHNLQQRSPTAGRLKVTLSSLPNMPPGVLALGRRRSRLRLDQAAFFTLAAFELPTVSRCQPRSTLRPLRLESFTLGTSIVIPIQSLRSRGIVVRAASVACAAPSLRPGAPCGRILRYGHPVLRCGRNPYAGPCQTAAVHGPP